MRFYLKRISEARRSLWTFLILFIGLSLLTNCRKDKVKVPTPVEPTKWEKIAGDYKVYDTLGNYLYSMSLVHKDTILSNGYKIDSILFMNFDERFTFSSIQGFGTNYPELYIGISPSNPTLDYYGKRWQLYGISNDEFYFNTLKNDTIRLRFRLNNILYYMEDLVSFLDTTKNQVAVKQH